MDNTVEKKTELSLEEKISKILFYFEQTFLRGPPLSGVSQERLGENL